MSWSTLEPEVKAAWAKMNEWYEEGILDVSSAPAPPMTSTP